MSADAALGSARKRWMGLLATAPGGRAAALLHDLGPLPETRDLRAPQIGSVMVRGSADGSGAPFNLGEVSVTRASVALPCGTVGHGYVQGRRREDARVAAVIDALMQTGAVAQIGPAVVDRLAAERATLRADRAAKAAATRVEFVTMARGEDP